MTDKDKSGYRSDTHMIHGQFRTEKWEYDHHVIPPITASTTFRLDSASRGRQGFVDFGEPKKSAQAMNPVYIYDRLDEPTVGMLEDLFREIEQGESACAFACGMSAISAALMVACHAGSNIVAHRTLYGCTFSLMTNWLPRFGVDVRFVDARDLDQLRGAMDGETRAVYLETPANPTMECLDVAAVKDVIELLNRDRPGKERIVLVADNTFATPWAQRPLELGADLVVESLTKDVGGFGVDMGGMVVAPRRFHKSLRGFRKDFGGVLPPGGAWRLMVYGVSTLSLRVRRQTETAWEVARFLEGHDKVARVSYPGLDSYAGKEVARRQLVDPDGRFCPGFMVYFEVTGGLEEARARCERLVNHIASHSYCITLAVSLGMTKTLVETPGLMTHSVMDAGSQSEAGIHPGGVRLAMGLESPSDIIRDLTEALDGC
ncbi:MAG: PLP-dependent transferase [Deltaproteobacteria bacterium]|nr:PLP-dependent transferase [Deltaproteobacteria bacterium]